MGRTDGTAASGVITAFVLGAMTGAAVALLMAPAPGDDTRRRLGEKAREGRVRAEGAARQGRELITRGRDTLSSAFERGREAYEQARQGGPQPPAAPSAPGAAGSAEPL